MVRRARVSAPRPGTDLLDGLSGRFGQGVGYDRGQSRFGQKILAQLAKRAKTVSRQNVANLGRVQSWRLKMA